jgi:hypothetical protein
VDHVIQRHSGRMADGTACQAGDREPRHRESDHLCDAGAGPTLADFGQFILWPVLGNAIGSDLCGRSEIRPRPRELMSGPRVGQPRVQSALSQL